MPLLDRINICFIRLLLRMHMSPPAEEAHLLTNVHALLLRRGQLIYVLCILLRRHN